MASPRSKEGQRAAALAEVAAAIVGEPELNRAQRRAAARKAKKKGRT